MARSLITEEVVAETKGRYDFRAVSCVAFAPEVAVVVATPDTHPEVKIHGSKRH